MNAKEQAEALVRANREYDRLHGLQAEMEYRAMRYLDKNKEKSVQYWTEAKKYRNLAKIQEKRIDILTRW